MPVKFTNRATSLLAGNITDSATSLSVTSSTGARFPALAAGEWFPLVVVAADGGYEIMRATARASDVITVTREQEGTTKRAFDAGSRVDLRLTTAAVADILAQALANTSDVSGATVTDALNTLLSQKLDAADIDLQAKWSTGDIKLTFKVTADPGWLMLDDSTIGDATSGATHAGSQYQTLFKLLFSVIPDSFSPIFTSAGAATTRAAQTNYDLAWANHCRVSLSKALGRAVGIAGAGAGLTPRSLGQVLGEETHALTASENGPHDHGGETSGQSADHTHNPKADTSAPQTSNPTGRVPADHLAYRETNGDVEMRPTSGASNDHFHNIPPSGSGSPHNNMQPTTFFNAMVKL